MANPIKPLKEISEPIAYLCYSLASDAADQWIHNYHAYKKEKGKAFILTIEAFRHTISGIRTTRENLMVLFELYVENYKNYKKLGEPQEYLRRINEKIKAIDDLLERNSA